MTSYRSAPTAHEVLDRPVGREKKSETVLDLVGIAVDEGPLIDKIPVSERPELYLVELERPSGTDS